MFYHVEERYFFSGTGFQDFWDQNPSKNVATKHEDKADCLGNFDSTDPYNSPICVSWVQLWEIGAILRGPLSCYFKLEIIGGKILMYGMSLYVI